MPDISLQRVSQPAGVPRLNVIFVHGLGGDPVTTWCHKGEDRYFWPRGIAEVIEGAAVYTLGYPGDKAAWNTGWPIAMAATAILDKLMASPELWKHAETPIAFVCHSLGGLIIKKLVVTAYLDQGQAPLKGKLLDRIAGVVCLATPHGGSVLGTFARAVHWFVSKYVHDLAASDAALLDLAHSYRDRIANKEARIRHRIHYETVPVAGAPIDSPWSADPGLEDSVYEGVIAFLQDEVLQPRASPSQRRAIESPPKRKLNAWISNSRPKVCEAFCVSINIDGDAKDAPAASVEFLEPQWSEAKSLDLIVSVSCLDCTVKPSWQELRLPRTGDSDKIKFCVTSRQAGDREFTVRVYLAKQMIQLQSLHFTVTVAEAQAQPTEAL